MRIARKRKLTRGHTFAIARDVECDLMGISKPLHANIFATKVANDKP